LGKLIGVSAHATKIASGKAMFDKFSDLITKVLSIIRFHLTVDGVGPSTITKMEI